MAIHEIRGPLFLNMPTDPESKMPSGSVRQWTQDTISSLSTDSVSSSRLAKVEERVPLKRQAAIRRDGNMQESKARSPMVSGGSSDGSSSRLSRASSVTCTSPTRAEGYSPRGLAQEGSSSSSPTSPKSVSFGRETFLQPNAPRIRNGSISRNSAQGLTLAVEGSDSAINKQFSALSFDDPETPRPRMLPEDASTSSNCASEENKQLLTPLDSTMPLVLGHGASSLSQVIGTDSPPMENDAAERVGISFGVGSIGASADVGQLGLGLDGRRSMPDGTPSPEDEGNTRVQEYVSPRMAKSSSRSGAPILSHSTLYQLGMIEGITPPASTVSATGAGPLEVSSVVSTGLEMGLGVSLSATALLNSIPGASSAVSGLAEPRYSRPTRGSIDQGSLQSGPSVTEAEIPAATPYSDRAADETPLSALENANNELHRRRTTGWTGPKGRPELGRITTRHQRADTHDPVVSHARMQMLLQQQEKQQYQQNNYMSLRSSPVITTQGLPSSYMLDMPLSAEISLDRNSSLGGQSSSRAHASAGGSTHPETPSLGEKAILSPDAEQHADGINSFYAQGSGAGVKAGGQDKARGRVIEGQYGNDNGPAGPANGALMGLGAGGHFGPGVKAKVSEVLPKLIASMPLSGEEGETVTITEYGCLNTRSLQLMQPIISWFAEKAHANQPQREAERSENVDDFFNASLGHPALRTVLGAGAPTDYPCRINFSIIHEDSPQADFRPVSQTLDTSSDSYLNPHWLATHEPSLQNAIFPSFVSRPFASRIAPPSTMHLGISLMDLHWSHTPRNPAVSLATSAHAELIAFLTARAHEFKKGGVFVMAYIARSGGDAKISLPGRPKSTIDCTPSPTDASVMNDSAIADGFDSPTWPTRPIKKERTRSNSTPMRPAVSPTAANSSNKADIWTTLTDTLAPCLQRLVSCGMLKSDVARHLLSLPMHPRTPRQTQSVLKSVQHLWKTEWSCGLGEGPGSSVLESEPEPLRLPHPAWKALQAGTLSRVAFAEHMIQLFKNLYEAHFRVILREKGRLSKGAVEFVLDSLWDVLQSRIDDQEPCPIAQCELEVQVVALRRV